MEGIRVFREEVMGEGRWMGMISKWVSVIER